MRTSLATYLLALSLIFSIEFYVLRIYFLLLPVAVVVGQRSNTLSFFALDTIHGWLGRSSFRVRAR